MSAATRRPVPVADLTVIALIGVAIVVGKTVLRLPIHLPGHSGIFWIAAMIVGRRIVRFNGAATMMGLVGGILVAIIQPSDGGFFFAVAKYVCAGVVLDLFTPLVAGRLDRLVPGILAGALAHTGKVVVDVAQSFAAGLPPSVIAAGLTIDTVAHIAFGALGGLIGVTILRTLVRARIPQLASLGDAEPDR